MEGEIKEVVENECGSAERESSNLALHCDPRRSTMYACGRGQHAHGEYEEFIYCACYIAGTVQ